jgi:pimeloyl-ACP methyl ester carboxylesterase
MKTKNKLVAMVFSSFIILNIATIQQAISQNRGSVWVHGLNSVGSNWNKWEQLFTFERQLNNSTGWPLDYITGNGVQATAQEVRFSYAADNRNIYFGHSMGGVVGREVDVNFAGSVGGLVTFGSPLDGAKIANSLANGQTDAFINNGVDKVTRGPIRQWGFVPYLVWNLGVEDLVQKYVRDEVNKKFPVNQGSRDLEEGSAYLQNGIRNAQTATPKIHVYGNENAPVLWRFASSANEFNNGGAAFNDTYFVDFTNILADVYEAIMWQNIAIGAAVGWFTFGIGAIYFYWVADGWMDGKNWLRYDSESGWNYLIGSSTWAYRQVCYQGFNYELYLSCIDPYDPYGNNYYDSGYDYFDLCYQYATYYYCYNYYSPVNGQSDGFIKAPSQTGYNSDWSNNATRIEAFGVNHIEMLDNEKVADIFRDIFDGRRGVHPFFITPRK